MAPIVRTVLGDVPPETLGRTLFHEHLSSDMARWIGDPDLKLTDAELAASELTLAAADGLSAIVDATTNDVGRDLGALVAAARTSGVQVIAGGGLYRELTYPESLRATDEEPLFETFVREVAESLGAEGVRAGAYGEIGTSHGGITPRERTVLRAVGRAHLATGAPILTHTPEGQDALEQLDILESVGVDPRRVAIGHVDCLADPALHRSLAERGAFVGFDRVGLARYLDDETRVELVLRLLEAGHADKLLLSSDLARKSRLKRHGGLGYANVLTDFVPRLSAAGVDDATLEQILVYNPARFLAFEPQGRAA
jgi:predicted metal-dependent phosphotriesterase family hydrolase